MVDGASSVPAWDERSVEAALVEAISAGVTTKDAVKQVTSQSGWPKRKVYALAQTIKEAAQ